MYTLGIHHVSINVNDVAEAERFYCEVLGLEKLPRPDLGFAGAWLQTGAQQVHLLGKGSVEPLPEQHYAFLIDDAAALLERLESHNITRAALAKLLAFVDRFLCMIPAAIWWSLINLNLDGA